MEELCYLLLCGLISIPGSLEENLAFKGTTTQSSNYYSFEARYAIDGVRYSLYETENCAHTGENFGAWWRLDLLKSYEISTVIITARSDAYIEETNGAEIRIGNSLTNNGNNNPRCAVTSDILIGQTISYSCDWMEGRYVNIVMTGRLAFLTLCEVEVYDAENLSFRGTATQSSTYNNLAAGNAIDGLRYGSGEAAHCSVTEYGNSSWWRLDLLENYDISTITVTARSDGYLDQTNGAEIRIGNSLDNNGNNNPRCAVTSGFRLGGTISYSCSGMDVRYVNVVMTGRMSALSLCEVEVFGKRHRIKQFLRLKFFSTVDAAAVSDQILHQLQSFLALHISDFKVSWTKLPQQEVIYQPQKNGPCA